MQALTEFQAEMWFAIIVSPYDTILASTTVENVQAILVTEPHLDIGFSGTSRGAALSSCHNALR
jgi:hypothetical protein